MTTIAKQARSRRWIARTFSPENRYQMINVAILLVLGFITVAPFLWVLVTAFKPDSEIYTTDIRILPQQITLEHFQAVFEKGDRLPTYMVNTFIYAGVTIFLVAILSSMAGYALGQLKIRASELIGNIILILLSLPWIILIVPILLFEFDLRIWNTRPGVILPYIALFLPLAIWIMRGTFTDMPSELGEAARIDGANEFTVFWRVYLPMGSGGVATVCLILFMEIWSEVLVAATFVSDPRLFNINTGLRVLADEGQSFAFGTMSAVILLAMIPTLIVFIFLQRYYVRGISEGALAGF